LNQRLPSPASSHFLTTVWLSLLPEIADVLAPFFSPPLYLPLSSGQPRTSVFSLIGFLIPSFALNRRPDPPFPIFPLSLFLSFVHQLPPTSRPTIFPLPSLSPLPASQISLACSLDQIKVSQLVPSIQCPAVGLLSFVPDSFRSFFFFFSFLPLVRFATFRSLRRSGMDPRTFYDSSLNQIGDFFSAPFF